MCVSEITRQVGDVVRVWSSVPRSGRPVLLGTRVRRSGGLGLGTERLEVGLGTEPGEKIMVCPEGTLEQDQ